MKDARTGKWTVFEDDFGGYNADSTFPVNPTLFRESYAYRLLVIFLQRAIKGNLAKSVDDIAISRWALKNIKDIADSRRIKLLGVLIPYFKSRYDEEQEMQYARARQLLNECKIRYLDLHDRFTNIDDLDWRKNREDWVHPSRKGHIVIARQIYDYLSRDLSWWLN